MRPRDDATYYPVPWLLSSRGYGVLIDRDETSTFHLATDPSNVWSAEVQSHAIALRVFGGPTLAQVLRRFTAATGRQPKPVAPWQYGPWFQADPPAADALRRAGVPMSAAEAQSLPQPCAGEPGDESAEVGSLHQRGLAAVAYVNPLLCASDEPLWDHAVAVGARRPRHGRGERHLRRLSPLGLGFRPSQVRVQELERALAVDGVAAVEELDRRVVTETELIVKPARFRILGRDPRIERHAIVMPGLDHERPREDEITQLRWVKPKLIAQVSFTEWTTYGMLRHATFEGLRDDKEPQEIVREAQ